MDENCNTVSTHMFRGIEYVVSMNIIDNNLVVEVEDRLTADQWRGSFDAPYVEDLTHKTGNYKQFNIFVSMLESALTQSSDSVSLDLLTYADLESLRKRKAGAGTKNVPGARTASLNSKRYLILTYTVEFDRIHYPLPLPYMGKPDPRSLQETIRHLRQELSSLKKVTTKDSRFKELEKLRKDYDRILLERDELEAEFIEYKREVNHTSQGAAAKEVRILKNIVKNLEEELVEEKAKHQKSSGKRNQEYRQLLEEVEELRASERNLKVRVKSLTNELAVYKRGRSGKSHLNASKASSVNSYKDRSGHSSYVRSPRDSRNNSGFSDRNSYLRNRSTSRERMGSSDPRSRIRDRSTSRERTQNRNKENSYNGSTSRGRSNSFGNRSRETSASRERARLRNESRERIRSRTPSPSGFTKPRFDPTAYVKEKSRRETEATMKKNRETRGKMNGINEKKTRPSPLSERNYSRRSNSRNSSLGSYRSLNSSVDSLTDIGMASDASDRRISRPSRQKRLSNAWSSPDVSYSKPKLPSEKVLASTPERVAKSKKIRSAKDNVRDSDLFDRSTEISEIDARLNRLQQFMKTTMQ